MIALVWIAIKSNTLSLSRRIWTSATLIAALMGAVALQNYLPVDSQMRLMNIDYSLNAPVVQGGALGRIEPIETALKLGMESPLFGSGLSLNATMGFYSHNLFSQAFLETGLVGVSGLVMVIISAFKGYLRRRAYTDGQVDFLGSMFVVYCVIHQFSFTAVLGLQFWLLAGIGSRLMGEGRQVASWSGSLVRRRRVHYAPLWAGLKQAL
jgi:O-antigen ligase